MNQFIQKALEIEKLNSSKEQKKFDELKESLNCYTSTKSVVDRTIDEMMGKERIEDNHIVIVTDGGLGDSIAINPLLKSAREVLKDKKIILSTFYPEIFYGNPNIDVLYSSHGITDLYEKWVMPLRNFKSIIKRDIYNLPIHRLFPGKLSEAYCYFYGFPYPGDDVKVYISEDEDKYAKMFIKSFSKPVILIQPYGARMVYKPEVQLTPNKNWFKENWEKLVDLLNKEFNIVQLGGANEEPIAGVTAYLMGQTNPRQTMALVKNALTFVCVDTFIGHVGAAVEKSGVVLFGRSNPIIFSHDINKNIWVDGSCKFNNLFCGRPESYFGDVTLYNGKVDNWICSHRSCMSAITPEMVMKKIFEAIEFNTKKI